MSSPAFKKSWSDLHGHDQPRGLLGRQARREEAQCEDPDDREGVHLDEQGPDDDAGGEQQPHGADQESLPTLWCDPDQADRQEADGGQDAGLDVDARMITTAGRTLSAACRASARAHRMSSVTVLALGSADRAP
jgi:hypothetical protein